MIFASRERRGPDRYLYWKLAALGVGVALLVVGDRTGVPWLGWVGVGVLVVGFLLRFVPQATGEQ